MFGCTISNAQLPNFKSSSGITNVWLFTLSIQLRQKVNIQPLSNPKILIRSIKAHLTLTNTLGVLQYVLVGDIVRIIFDELDSVCSKHMWDSYEDAYNKIIEIIYLVLSY
jgi:hypothetical protein